MTEKLEEYIPQIVEGFENWLKYQFETDDETTTVSGYEINIKDDKYVIIFGYAKNEGAECLIKDLKD